MTSQCHSGDCAECLGHPGARLALRCGVLPPRGGAPRVTDQGVSRQEFPSTSALQRGPVAPRGTGGGGSSPQWGAAGCVRACSFILFGVIMSTNSFLVIAGILLHQAHPATGVSCLPFCLPLFTPPQPLEKEEQS